MTPAEALDALVAEAEDWQPGTERVYEYRAVLEAALGLDPDRVRGDLEPECSCGTCQAIRDAVTSRRSRRTAGTEAQREQLDKWAHVADVVLPHRRPREGS